MLKNKHVISTKQFNRKRLEGLFNTAELIRTSTPASLRSLLDDQTLVALFYEPSTRTYSSFVGAMNRLGGSVIPIQDAMSSTSAYKGESLQDTIRVLERYADVIVIRHPVEGSVGKAAQVAHVPVINAGDGAGEHPTQAILDLYTIWRSKGSIDGLTITLMGDLKHSRCLQSLAKILADFKVSLNYVAPKGLDMPGEIQKELASKGVVQKSSTKPETFLETTDVLYTNRLQKERFTDPAEYQKYVGSFMVMPKDMARLKSSAILMNPLPRVGDISELVDADPRAIYFDQAENGLFVRMALLLSVLGRPLVKA